MVLPIKESIKVIDFLDAGGHPPHPPFSFKYFFCLTIQEHEGHEGEAKEIIATVF